MVSNKFKQEVKAAIDQIRENKYPDDLKDFYGEVIIIGINIILCNNSNSLGECIEPNCYETCKTCNSAGDSTNHKCTGCNNSTYFKQEGDSYNNCYNSSTKKTNYFIDTTNKIIKKCYDSCATCSSLGTSSAHKCNSCDNSQYYFKEGHSTPI